MFNASTQSNPTFVLSTIAPTTFFESSAFSFEPTVSSYSTDYRTPPTIPTMVGSGSHPLGIIGHLVVFLFVFIVWV